MTPTRVVPTSSFAEDLQIQILAGLSEDAGLRHEVSMALSSTLVALKAGWPPDLPIQLVDQRNAIYALDFHRVYRLRFQWEARRSRKRIVEVILYLMTITRRSS